MLLPPSTALDGFHKIPKKNIVPRGMAHVQCPFALQSVFVQSFQKDCQTCRDQCQILNSVVPEAMLRPRNQSCVKEAFEVGQSRASQKGSIRYATQQWNIVAPFQVQGFGNVEFGLFILVGSDLVDDNTRNANPDFLTHGSIQLQLVERITESAVGDQDNFRT